MNRNFTNYLMAGALVLVAGFVPAAKATTLTTLQDWCVNVDGSTSNCNTGAAVGVSGGFDFTLGTQVEGDPATAYSPTEAAPFNDQNGLGIFSVTLTAGSGQFAYMYMDYDLNANASGSFSDSAAAVGTPGTANAASVSYEMFDPNVGGGSWWSDFSGATYSSGLANSNTVGTYDALGGCCDVAWDLGVGVDVAAGYTDTVNFTVSTSAPEAGFYLKQTNGVDTAQSIYYSVSVTQTALSGYSAPEPTTWVLIASGLAGVVLMGRRMRKTQGDVA